MLKRVIFIFAGVTLLFSGIASAATVTATAYSDSDYKQSGTARMQGSVKFTAKNNGGQAGRMGHVFKEQIDYWPDRTVYETTTAPGDLIQRNFDVPTGYYYVIARYGNGYTKAAN